MDVIGTGGADTLTGTKGNDFYSGLGGSDTINATQGADVIDGGLGGDRFTMIMGNLARFDAWAGPRIYILSNSFATDSAGLLNSSLTSIERMTISTVGTGDYDDTIDASGFTSTFTNSMFITTGGGNDTIIGTGQADAITAGTGSNTIEAGGGIDSVAISYHNELGGTLFISGTNALLTTDFNGSEISTIRNAEFMQINGFSTTGGLTIDASGAGGFVGQIGYALANGNNVVIGHNGVDFFGNSSGWIDSVDTLTGNGGADIYDYTFAVGAMNGDRITDLDSDDIIDLQFNTPAQNGGFLANQFIGNAAFSGVVGQYRFDVDVDQGFTFVEVDTNGDGRADETLTITNGNFALAETSAGSNQLQLIGQSGGSGDDFLVGGLGDDQIYGQAGDDIIAATGGLDQDYGGDGYDQLRFIMANSNRFWAAWGTRTFTISDEWVGASDGSVNSYHHDIESIFLSTVGTGDYGDLIDGSGATRNLTIRAGNGNDTIIGGHNDDNIATGLGTNTIDAGDGYDFVMGAFDNLAGMTAYVTMSGGAVVTTVGGVVVNTVSNAELTGVGGFTVNGGSVIDASGLTGFSGTLLFGDTNGSNVAIGHAGSDYFANIFQGVTGTDVYTGNGGADTYDYTYAVGGMNSDIITDLDADDVIDLRFNDPTANGGGFLGNQFIGNFNFTGVAGQYRYYAQGGKTFLQVDTDGNGVADQTLTIANGQFALGETAPGSNLLHIIGASGTPAADTFTTSPGNDSLYGGAGNDIFFGSQGADFIDGGLGGGDRLHMITGDVSLFAAATGARTYVIGASSITDSSGTLNTSFTSVERINLSTVGNGDFDDTIDARGFVSTNANPLDIRLGNGDNVVLGSGGNDRIFTGFGSNTVDGGGGNDTAWSYVDSSSAVTITIGNDAGAATITANGQVSRFTDVETIVAQGVGTGTVTLDASGYTDIPGVLLILGGHDGTDIMIGSAGNDFFANATGQVLGNDRYTGNGGADIYDYTYAADSMNGDVITDFDIDDVIDLRFNNLEVGGSPLLANHFIGNAAFSGAAGEYRYQINGTQTIVQVDGNGDATVDQTLTIANGGFVLAETVAGSNILTLASVINTLDGVVADGYVAGATLFVDVNGNGVRDSGEAWTTTDADGNFTLNVNKAGAIVAVGGVNKDTGLANQMVMRSPYNASVVNPLTTLIAAVMAASSVSATAAEAQVKSALGLNTSLDLFSTDLLAPGGGAGALDAQKAAALIVNLVTTAETLPDATGATEAATMGALASLVANGPVNLANAATLNTILDNALGSDVPASVATQLASEASVINAASNIGAISDAQAAAALTGDSFDNTLTGGSKDDAMNGKAGNDTLYGLGGNDTLTGGTGRDYLFGGDGSDILKGGDGQDFLTGGAGNDFFVGEYGTKVTTKAGGISLDTVLDFQRGDKIDLAALDANTKTAFNDTFAWKGSGVSKDAGTVWFKTYDSVQGAEKALNVDIDGFAGPSPLSGPVTILFGNHDGGDADFAIALIGVGSLQQSDILL